MRKFNGYDDTPLGHALAQERMDREALGLPPTRGPGRDLESRVEHLEKQVRDLTRHLSALQEQT
jgi:hypothetical protein